MSRSRLVVDLTGTPANSRASIISRSGGNETSQNFRTTLLTDSSISKRQTRSSASFTTNVIMNGDEKIMESFHRPLDISLSARGRALTKPIISRASMSSVSTAHESLTSSGYSTPATSAVATPATTSNQEKSSRLSKPRGRPASSLANTLPAAALSAFQRAKNLRNSELSLNPISNKRKRYASDEDEEDGSDNSPDAQMAKALQIEENAKVNSFDNDDSDEIIPKRARHTLRTLRPKSDYVEDFSDGDIDIKPYSWQKRTALRTSDPKVKLVAANAAAKSIISETDSEESEFTSSDNDDNILSAFGNRSSPEIPLASLSTTRKATTQTTRARTGVLTKRLSASIGDRGTSKRGRGRSQGGSRGGSRIPSGRRSFSAAKALSNEGSEKGLTALNATTSTPISSNEEDEDSPPSLLSTLNDLSDLSSTDDSDQPDGPLRSNIASSFVLQKAERRAAKDRARLEAHHPEILTMWKELEDLPAIKTTRADQPRNISRELKPFQLEGLSWMQAMEKTAWGGGLLGDEMGMGKTIQAVSLIMSDYPAKNPSLVLIPPVALMQWQQEIGDYTDGTLKTFVFHGTNKNTKGMSLKDLKKFDVILMSYNSLESMYRHQEKGFKRKEEVHFQKSVIHQLHFHRVILDEAHSIKTRTTGVAKACFALKADHKWCLSGTPLQNRIGEFFSLVRFLDIRPFACYFCKQCPCSTLEWTMNEENRCISCSHSGMQHVSVFNQELLNPIQKYGNKGLGKVAFAKLRLLTDRFMLRRVKRDHSSAMELPAKEIQVDRQFFGEEENDFAASIMNNSTRKFETYVAQGVLLNNYANIFGLIMQMRQVADHPDLILKKNGEGGQNILVCCICDETAEDAIRSTCRHDFCRSCVKNYLKSSEDTDIQPDCPQCHIPLSIDLEQPEVEQDQQMVKKSSIINRIKMENWTSSSKIEALVHDLHSLRSHNSSSKSIIFSQFTTMLQLVEWRLRRAGITTVMLDGSMTPAQRQGSINHFMNDVNVECFLVSLKAGGVALNLTEASKVFIVDPWWNPAAEWQSADRCHRIGQCRPCSITRLCIEDSVESRMVLLQEKKANMINSTINADDSAMESLTPEDMQFLFRGN